MQVQRFHQGGYVIHKMVVLGRTVSAWFDAEGKLLDAEQMPIGRGLVKDGPLWREAQRIGGAFALETAE